MKALLITGANGWLGKGIIRNLINCPNYFSKLDYLFFHSLDKQNFLKENDIYILNKNQIKYANLTGSLTDKKLNISIKKLLLKNQIKELKVIHTASVIHPKKVSDFNKVNFLGLVDLYNSLDSQILSKFTYISSNSPFGFNKQGSYFNETSSYNPIGGYGESKKLAEEFLINLNEKEKITILRAPWFHGKDMPVRQAKFLIKASQGKFPMIGRGKNRRSLVNTNDLAIAALNVTMNNRKEQIYWVSDSSTYSMKEIIRIIQNTYKKNKNINKANAIKLPTGTSTIFSFLDLILQKFGIYNMYVHVLGELGQNIECNSSMYWNEFKSHLPSDFKNTIVDELKEAFQKNFE